MELKFFKATGKRNPLAYFTAVGKTMELRDLRLMNGKNGLFLSPPAREYTTKDGKTAYAPYYVILDKKLEEAILTAAEAELQKYGTKLVKQTLCQEDESIPF